MVKSSACEIKTTNDFIGVIAKSLADAVGDDIKMDVLGHGLITENSTPSRIWDLLNTSICKYFDKSDVIANPTKRGAWKLVPVFERSTGFIYTLMRESRFLTLKKELPKRRNAHYADALARSLNSDLRASNGQLTLFPISYFNNNHIEEIVQKILSDLAIPNELVKRHALILFESSNYELSSLRCCVIDSNLDIVNEANWSSYIKASEGVVPDMVDNKTSPFTDPTAGLQYKQKAKDKMDQKTLSKDKISDKESHNIE